VLNAFYGVALSRPDYEDTQRPSDVKDKAACSAARRRTSQDDAWNGNAPAVPDGMECSTRKPTAQYKRHPSWAAIAKFMSEGPTKHPSLE
jgi:hypothetical protein